MDAQFPFNIGDTVFLQIPNNDSPSNGMAGTVQDKKVFRCGNMHYDVIWTNGGRFWVPWDWLKNEGDTN